MRSMTDLVASMRRNSQAIFAVAMIVIVALLIWTARGALPAFFIGLALAFVLDPIVTFLARYGAPRWAGVIVAYIAVVLVVWGLIAYAVPPIARQTSEFIVQLPQLGAAVGDIERGIVDRYERLPLPTEIRRAVDSQVASSGSVVKPKIRITAVGMVVVAVTRTTPELGLVTTGLNEAVL